MTGKEWISAFEGRGAGEEAARYVKLASGFLDDALFPRSRFPEAAGSVRFFTAAGRTELGGNHTDHNNGKVLAAAVQLDAVAVAAGRDDARVSFRSTGFPDVDIDISDTSVRENEKGKTEALVRGIAAGFVSRNIPVRGWSANIDSTVFPGSGLSSSAAIGVLIAKIFDCLYNGGRLAAVEIAKIAQKAENLYYGKPCGLMDQAASAFGGAVAIDFGGDAPVISQIDFNPGAAGYALCVVNTGGDHADLTGDYAAIPAEMKSVAAFFGAANLREAGKDAFFRALADGRVMGNLRRQCGDRALLRALHFFNENDTVDKMHAALQVFASAGSSKELCESFARFLGLVRQSGASSQNLLQNISSPHSLAGQPLAVALALTDSFASRLGKDIACRVHGGGFAGTVQAYVPLDCLPGYRAEMEAVFGTGAVTELKISGGGARELRIEG
ncbi:MAG: galactokinase [Spirochaetes bacterium]|nr:galactokinase [Spirochaetota bacterium]